MSRTLALVSVVAATSCTLAAARSSALMPTPLIERAASSSVAAVASEVPASASPSFFTAATEVAISRRPVPVDSWPTWTSFAVSAACACARASDWAAVAACSMPTAIDSIEARICSLAAACSLPLAAMRVAASSIECASAALSSSPCVAPVATFTASSMLTRAFPFWADLTLFAMCLLLADHLGEIDQHEQPRSRLGDGLDHPVGLLGDDGGRRMEVRRGDLQHLARAVDEQPDRTLAAVHDHDARVDGGLD